MSKLDNILKAYGESLTGYELTSFWSEEKEQIKELMLELVGPQVKVSAFRTDDETAGYNRAIREFTEKVEAL
jgi:hypothetical protein